MGIYHHHVLAAIYVFVTMACSEHLVKSDQLGEQRIRECHGRNEDCSAEGQKGGKDNILLRLPRIEGVKVGHTQEMELTKGSKHTVRTLSLKPPVFEIPNFFTDEECEMIIDLALEKGMSESPPSQDTDKSADKDPWEEKIKAWDRNKNGFIDKTEIKARFQYLALG
ncbi:transmembrane prolyl 4-hydroxylase-like [Orbicella faveolata]|uniref:transmembrane prolyl 4-hydroxylase-like n=1 Tax=Orbicella faveolata TaxID=48498 RepID=UPI0009E25717|nr:transmembrane prolyl 4-hydroxylase-like [Orbicella faveolata]